MKITEQEQKEAIKSLKKMLKPGDTVYTILRHVSRSGMFRYISLVIIGKDRKPLNIDWNAERVGLAERPTHNNNRYGLRVGGCGMDMGFHLVYSLGRILWPKGNGKFTINRNGNTKPETDGGYFLNHEWI